ncbi:hypothetical protein [Candidatus Phytoplasma pruni]|nr:hypothetical protein [Candidatus Phytoplasma pruni]
MNEMNDKNKKEKIFKKKEISLGFNLVLKMSFSRIFLYKTT